MSDDVRWACWPSQMTKRWSKSDMSNTIWHTTRMRYLRLQLFAVGYETSDRAYNSDKIEVYFFEAAVGQTMNIASYRYELRSIRQVWILMFFIIRQRRTQLCENFKIFKNSLLMPKIRSNNLKIDQKQWRNILVMIRSIKNNQNSENRILRRVNSNSGESPTNSTIVISCSIFETNTCKLHRINGETD